MIAHADLMRRVQQYKWFHTIDLGNGIVTPGATAPELHRADVKTIFDPIKMAGTSVIDVGAWNGLYSFEAKRRGATRVLATDHFVWSDSHLRGRETFDLARDALGMQVEAKDIDVPDISVDAVGTFDVVLFLGVFYHLFDPIDGLRRVASITGEVLVVVSHIDLEDVPRPAMVMYPGSELAGDPTNWWGPNVACIKSLLQVLGFERVDYTRLPRPTFHAWRSDRLRSQSRKLDDAVAERDQLQAERYATIVDRDFAAAGLAAVKASSSSRITALIRRIAQAIR
jgi:tRNA (mo5U34)-methyltransferase